MPLSSGLYRSQDQQEQDLMSGPFQTIDDQKPSTFDNFLGALPRGIGQGVADSIDVLTHGFAQTALPALARANPFMGFIAGTDEQGGAQVEKIPGWKQSQDELQQVQDNARDFSKSLIPDPRVTGTASNIVQGFSKAATEFTGGALVGGPAGGAAMLGAADGYAHYSDLLDQGVDEDTATKSGLLTAITSGASAFLPMGMPAKWLAGLSVPGTLLAQAAAGATINTAFGTANRYAQAAILRDAGYDTAADQQKPIDAENLLTDAISGAFFGAHAGWHGIKDLRAEDIDPSIRDAAKVVQDRQEVVERAPGTPVDPKSAAVNRELLANAVAQRMAGRDVDSSAVDVDGAAFARGDVNDEAAKKIIQDEFMSSGVLDEEASFNKWLENGFDDGIPEVKKPAPAEPELDEHPDADTVTKLVRDKEAEDGSVVAEQTLGQKATTSTAQQALLERPEMELPQQMAEAFHGSPHVFDAFDMTKIGTGEGLAAYGHGIYLAENKRVAEYYQREVARQHISEDSPHGMASRILESINDDMRNLRAKAKTREDWASIAARDPRSEASAELRRRAKESTSEDYSKKANQAADLIEGGDISPTGNLYRVHIPSDTMDRLMHWDKPLSEQPQEIRESVAKAIKAIPEEKRAEIDMADAQWRKVEAGEPTKLTGRDVYEKLVESLQKDDRDIPGQPKGWGAVFTGKEGQPEASQRLFDAGIHGLRYLDQISGGAEDGVSHNLVLFHDKLAKIIQRNDEPLNAAAALEAAKHDESQANKEADPMHEAAVNCEARYA